MQHKITKLSLQVVENDVEIPLLQPRLSLNINEAFESRNSSSTCYFVRMRNCDSSSLSAFISSEHLSTSSEIYSTLLEKRRSHDLQMGQMLLQ